MRKAIKIMTCRYGLNALLGFFIVGLMVSCEKDPVQPVYPQPIKYELEDFLGEYRIAQDQCNDILNEYKITIVKERIEDAKTGAMIHNFGMQKEALISFMNNGRLEIPSQRRFLNGNLKTIEGYIYKKKDGVGIVLYNSWDEHIGEKTDLCEVKAVKVEDLYETPEGFLPEEPLTVDKP